MSIWNNGIKYKYMFMILQKNLPRKGLILLFIIHFLKSMFHSSSSYDMMCLGREINSHCFHMNAASSLAITSMNHVASNDLNDGAPITHSPLSSDQNSCCIAAVDLWIFSWKYLWNSYWRLQSMCHLSGEITWLDYFHTNMASCGGCYINESFGLKWSEGN